MARRLSAPEIGEEDFQRLSRAAKSSEVKKAFEAAVEWSRLGLKYLRHLHKNRQAYDKWAKKGGS